MNKLTYGIALACLACGTANAQNMDFFNAASKVGGHIVKNNAEGDKVANMSEADEVALGRKLAAGVLAQTPAITNDSLQRYLNKVGLWVALQSSRPGLPWRFAAIDSKAVNAYAVPGGTILVTMGMLDQLSNEAELACVLGHEVGHVSRKHHLTVLQESLSQKGWIDGATEVIGDEVSRRGVGGQVATGLIKAPIQESLNKFMSLSLDRKAETEADQDGVVLAAKAGYDPGSCLAFMQRLASTKTDPTWLEALGKTHPPAQTRSSDIEATLRRLSGATPGEGARPALALNGNGKKKN